jgi:hypothetical protein
MTNKLSTHLPVRIVAYCATCDSEYGEIDGSGLGVPFICENDSAKNPTHHAQVVKGQPGKFWLRKRLWIYKYETRWCLRRWFKCWGGRLQDKAGLLIFIQFQILLLALLFEYRFSKPNPSCILLLAVPIVVSIYLIFDILLVNSSVAFVSRFPADPLRSALFANFCFVNLVFAFSIFYLALGDCFNPVIDNPIEALYFSFVTMTTLGYGDFHPTQENGWPVQLVVIFQLSIGLYFLAVLINIFVSWTNKQQAPEPKILKDLLDEYEKKAKN